MGASYGVLGSSWRVFAVAQPWHLLLLHKHFSATPAHKVVRLGSILGRLEHLLARLGCRPGRLRRVLGSPVCHAAWDNRRGAEFIDIDIDIDIDVYCLRHL